MTAGPLVLALDQADNQNIPTPGQVALASVSAEELDFRSRPVSGNRSWADQVLWECNLIDLAAVAQGRDGHFRGLLRPFLDAGSWDATQFAVWLRAPGCQINHRWYWALPCMAVEQSDVGGKVVFP